MDILDKGRRRNSFQVKRLLDGGGEDSKNPKGNNTKRQEKCETEGVDRPRLDLKRAVKTGGRWFVCHVNISEQKQK